MMASLDVVNDNDYHFNCTPSLHMHLMSKVKPHLSPALATSVQRFEKLSAPKRQYDYLLQRFALQLIHPEPTHSPQPEFTHDSIPHSTSRTSN